MKVTSNAISRAPCTLDITRLKLPVLLEDNSGQFVLVLKVYEKSERCRVLWLDSDRNNRGEPTGITEETVFIHEFATFFISKNKITIEND